MPTSANPYIPPEEIEAARLDLTETAFNQEYSALFVNWEGSVFRRVGEAATATALSKPEPGHDYVIGCDWGRSNDYTVFIVLDATAKAVVRMDRSNRVDYAVQCDRLKALAEQWQPRQIIAEQNSIGQPVIEQLTRDGLHIQPFITTNASKAQVIEALALAFERADIRILNDPTLVNELVAYQAERLPSGLLRYGAPDGGHDDTVISLALAWSAVSGRHRLIYPVPDRDIVVQQFPIPEHWPRAYGLDVRWHTAAAIWGARDPLSDVVYLYSEYLGDDDPAIHVSAIRARAEWIPGLIDAAANGRAQVDGQRLIQTYRKLGLHLRAVDNSLESGILDVWQRMHCGRLKSFLHAPKISGGAQALPAGRKGSSDQRSRQPPGRYSVSDDWSFKYALQTSQTTIPSANPRLWRKRLDGLTHGLRAICGATARAARDVQLGKLPVVCK